MFNVNIVFPFSPTLETVKRTSDVAQILRGGSRHFEKWRTLIVHLELGREEACCGEE
jgi:hypothetical protein